MLRENKPHKHLTQFVQSKLFKEYDTLFKFNVSKYKEYDTLFIGDGAMENKK